MSNPSGPNRRRRIAGESKPTVEPAETKRKLVPKVPKKTPAAAKPVGPAGPPVSKTAPAPAKTAQTGTPIAAAELPAAARFSLPPRTEWRWFIPLTLVALAAVVFGAFLGVRGVSDFRDERGIESSNTRASAKAGKAAETIFSFQYNKLDQHLTESKKLMTPKFKKEFDKIAPALTELAPQRKIQVQAQSRNAAPLECGNECSPTKSSVLVFIDQARLVGDSKKPTVFGNRIVVDMVKRNGTWLVADIKAL